MRGFVVLAGLVLALCGCEAHRMDRQTGAASEGIAAPIPSGVALAIRAEDAGKTLATKPGARIAVALSGVPTAGYVWAAAQTPPFLKPAGETGGPTHKAQLQPGFAGGSHWEVLMFDVSGPGEGMLVLEQRRPWETSEPPAATFSVRLQAK